MLDGELRGEIQSVFMVVCCTMRCDLNDKLLSHSLGIVRHAGVTS